MFYFFYFALASKSATCTIAYMHAYIVKAVSGRSQRTVAINIRNDFCIEQRITLTSFSWVALSLRFFFVIFYLINSRLYVSGANDIRNSLFSLWRSHSLQLFFSFFIRLCVFFCVDSLFLKEKTAFFSRAVLLRFQKSFFLDSGIGKLCDSFVCIRCVRNAYLFGYCFIGLLCCHFAHNYSYSNESFASLVVSIVIVPRFLLCFACFILTLFRMFLRIGQLEWVMFARTRFVCVSECLKFEKTVKESTCSTTKVPPLSCSFVF